MKKINFFPAILILLSIMVIYSCKSKGRHGGGVHNGFCVTGDTKIAGENGNSVEINKLKVGDAIMSYNEKTGSSEVATVLEMKTATHNNLVQLNFENTSVKITNDHPVWVSGKGWASLNPEKTMSYINLTNVKLLTEGDVCFVLNADGKIVPSKLVKATKLNGNFETYTITKLSNNKRFFANGIVVGVEELTVIQ